MRGWAKVFAVLFTLPVVAFAFFSYAPTHVEGRIKKSFSESLAKQGFAADVADKYKAEIDSLNLGANCLNSDSAERELIEAYKLQSVCSDFKYFSWARLASILLIALAAVHMSISFVCAQYATRSREALLQSFRIAWASSILLSLLILIGQAVLSAALVYYFTIVLADRYYPQLIGVLLLGGAFGCYQVVKMLLSKAPIETDEPVAQEVTREAAPQLWTALSEIARKLQMKEPETVLVGMGTSFYVTEFPVKHANGVSRGRTLHLSAPMMQQMTPDEVLAIVGHEFGHFKGDDTLFSNEISPLLFRAEKTKEHLVAGGLAGWPAIQAMNVFSYFFERVIKSNNRERELIADSVGASVTSPETAARALVRYSFKNEAHDAAVYAHLTQGESLEAATSKFQRELLNDSEFWSKLKGQTLPHPYDSHPPLAARVQKLGFDFDTVRASVSAPVETNGYDVLLGKNSTVLAESMARNEKFLSEERERQKILATRAEDFTEDIVKSHFPEIVMPIRGAALRNKLIALGALALIPLLLFIVIDHTGTRIGCAIAFAVLIFFMREIYVTLKDQVLTITHLGVQLSTWKEMLRYDTIAEMTPFQNNGTFSLMFKFYEKRTTPAKRAWFPNWKRKSFSIDITNFTKTPVSTSNTIVRYYLKEKA